MAFGVVRIYAVVRLRPLRTCTLHRARKLLFSTFCFVDIITFNELDKFKRHIYLFIYLFIYLYAIFQLLTITSEMLQIKSNIYELYENYPNIHLHTRVIYMYKYKLKLIYLYNYVKVTSNCKINYISLDGLQLWKVIN